MKKRYVISRGFGWSHRMANIFDIIRAVRKLGIAKELKIRREW